MGKIQSAYHARYIALYCRVSTDEQAREGVSLDEQQERLKAYCRAMGWNEDVVLFIDDGYSAKSTERPQLTKLLSEIKEGNVSKIMVTKLDRVSRRLLDLLMLIDLFMEYNVAFISISESFDTNTPSGRLTLQVLGAVAEFERERIRERVFENMHHAANQGKWLTQSPYGYRLEEKALVIFPPEAEIVKRVYQQFVEQGFGYYAIAKLLNEEGIPSRHQKEWSIRSIKLMLSNPVYKGTLVWNRMDSSKKKRTVKEEEDWIVVEDCLPVIIEKEIWNKAQAVMEKPSVAPRAKTSPHLLGGFLKCGKCGSGMSIGWSGSPRNRYRVYRCSANKNKGTCTSKQYKADEVESWFKEGLSQLCQSLPTMVMPFYLERVLSYETNQAEQKLRTAKNRYKRKVEAYTAGLIEMAELQEEKIRLDQVEEEVNRIGNPRSNSVDLSLLEATIRNQLQNIIDAIEAIPVEDAKALIGTLVEKVILLGEAYIEIVLNMT
ncbi:site-specific DNA recombinase [Brevibacillus nitrificans]|nr:recombinase family protein [Brevibacillus nitrificans]MDR7319677.1 site-specific DNA recombinase [Brevibacillus nitrificans]